VSQLPAPSEAGIRPIGPGRRAADGSPLRAGPRDRRPCTVDRPPGGSPFGERPDPRAGSMAGPPPGRSAGLPRAIAGPPEGPGFRGRPRPAIASTRRTVEAPWVAGPCRGRVRAEPLRSRMEASPRTRLAGFAEAG